MKTIAATLLVFFSVLTIHFALGASSPDRPAGVDAGHWIPVSDKMGFVDTSPHPFPPAGAALAPPTEGYFMVLTLRQGLSQRTAVRKGEVHAPNDTAWTQWLGRSKGRMPKRRG